MFVHQVYTWKRAGGVSEAFCKIRFLSVTMGFC